MVSLSDGGVRRRGVPNPSANDIREREPERRQREPQKIVWENQAEDNECTDMCV